MLITRWLVITVSHGNQLLWLITPFQIIIALSVCPFDLISRYNHTWQNIVVHSWLNIERASETLAQYSANYGWMYGCKFNNAWILIRTNPHNIQWHKSVSILSQRLIHWPNLWTTLAQINDSKSYYVFNYCFRDVWSFCHKKAYLYDYIIITMLPVNCAF